MTQFRLISLLILVAVLNVFATEVPTIKLDQWHCIGPFKDEAFGNVLRSLEYPFAPESEALSDPLTGPDLKAEYEMKAFPGYLQLKRAWQVQPE
ncbi:MAG: hypothetical protein E4H16_03265, partial [Candidatus Atribacteria bacterium]